MVNGQERKASVNGSPLCLNSHCPKYKTGRNTTNCDVEAPTCIAIAGAATTMRYGQALPPFCNQPFHSNACITSPRVSLVKSADRVTTTAVWYPKSQGPKGMTE
jgi:hypothetical protein